jgi:type II secretory pathway pseudopilin PulG
MKRTMTRPGVFAAKIVAVVVCSGVIGSIAVSNLRHAWRRSQQKRTMAGMRTIGTAWEARVMDTHSFSIGPVATRTIAFEELQAAMVPRYAKAFPAKDAWGNEWTLRTRSDSVSGSSSYAIRSAGSDGILESDISDFAISAIGEIERFEQDIVFTDGNFIRYAEGI